MHCQACSGLIMQSSVGYPYQYPGKVCYCQYQAGNFFDQAEQARKQRMASLIQKQWEQATQQAPPPLPPTIVNTQETYEAFVARTNRKDTYECLLLGLCGETGEVADTYKKHLYKNAPLNEIKMKEELGDVLWYVTALASKLGLTLEQLEELNKAKLTKRMQEESNKL